MKITTKKKNKIIAVFQEIDNVSPHINSNRKRMINTNFIMKQIFNDMQVITDYNAKPSQRKPLNYSKHILKLINNDYDRKINK